MKSDSRLHRSPGRGAILKAVRATGLASCAAIALWSLAGAPPELGLGQFVAHAEAPAAAPAGHRPTVRLISQGQYVNSIHQIFGPDIEVTVRLAPVNRVDGLLEVGASSAVLTGGGLDPLESSARAVAEQIVAPERRPFLFACKPAHSRAADDRCATAFLSRAGRLLYRRPLSQAELVRVVGIAHQAVERTGDFYDGIAFALSGMLVAPEFLFIREETEPDPANLGGSRLTGYAKATRLSFLLWNASPDEELLEAAEHGDLHSPAGLRKQVDRMIASPLYEEGVRAFFADFFVMEAFDTLAKDPTIYPGMTLKAIGEAREQLLRTVVDHLVTRHGDYRDLYTTRRTFLSTDLGVLYKLPVGLGPQSWEPYEFGANDPRAGILTQIGFLAQHAHPGRSSATRRGRAIREILLCQSVPNPPPNVDFSKFEGPKAEAVTARARLSAHNENPVCAGCHRLTDPLGLALENFDGAGRFRTQEKGMTIDASGALDGVSFTNAVGLGQALRDNPSLKSCIVNRLYAYSLGRKLTGRDEQVAEAYEAQLEKQGFRFDDMLRLIVLDPTFFSVAAPLRQRDSDQTAYLGG
jgi:hypothetical protein